MFAAVGNHVVGLHRDRVGALDLPDDLAAGGYRVLAEAEKDKLFTSTSLLLIPANAGTQIVSHRLRPMRHNSLLCNDFPESVSHMQSGSAAFAGTGSFQIKTLTHLLPPIQPGPRPARSC